MRVSRRTVLRGVGCTLALPWLESLPAWAGPDPQTGITGPLPKRFAVLFISIMDRMDVKLDRFGDAETRLTGL